MKGRGPFRGPMADDWHLGEQATSGLERVFPRNAGTPGSAASAASSLFGIPDASVAIDRWHLQPFTFARPGGRITQVSVAYQGNDGTETGVNVGLALWDRDFNLLHAAVGTRSAGNNFFTNFTVDWRGVPQICFIGLAHADAAGAYAKAYVLAHMVGSIIPGDKGYAFANGIIWPSNPYQSSGGAWDGPPDARNGDQFNKSTFVSAPFGQYVSWSPS